jgi:hypothetical protein
MSVRVSQKERGLVERETQHPDAGGSPEPGEDVFAHHRLDCEEQKSARKYRDGEEQNSSQGDWARRFRLEIHGVHPQCPLDDE